MISPLGSTLPEPGIARGARRRYFREETRYESWGAQGKLLALQEALVDAGVSPRDLTPWHIDMERIVDYIFPRTFLLYKRALVSGSLSRSVRMHSAKLSRDLSDYLVDAAKRYRVVCEEASAKFSLPVDQIEEILTDPQLSNDEAGVTFL
ncbi:MAG TPA: hypothetical protein VES59_00025 [Bacteroidota bacterium]|nr:hypothetical protein [Bacteroidota bacterium]